MENDLVDILLATYNSNIKYLQEQIDSLLCQTHKNIKTPQKSNTKTPKNNKPMNKHNKP